MGFPINLLNEQQLANSAQHLRENLPAVASVNDGIGNIVSTLWHGLSTGVGTGLSTLKQDLFEKTAQTVADGASAAAPEAGNGFIAGAKHVGGSLWHGLTSAIGAGFTAMKNGASDDAVNALSDEAAKGFFDPITENAAKAGSFIKENAVKTGTFISEHGGKETADFLKAGTEKVPPFAAANEFIGNLIGKANPTVGQHVKEALDVFSLPLATAGIGDAWINRAGYVGKGLRHIRDQFFALVKDAQAASANAAANTAKEVA